MSTIYLRRDPELVGIARCLSNSCLGYLCPRRVSRHCVLIVKPLSRVITSINYRPLSTAVTASLICSCSMARAICNDSANLEAVTLTHFPITNKTLRPARTSFGSGSYHKGVLLLRFDAKIKDENEDRILETARCLCSV